MERRFRDSPQTCCPLYPCLPHDQRPHQSGTLVTTDDPSPIYRHPKCCVVFAAIKKKIVSTTLIEKPDKLPNERIVDKTFVDMDVKLFNNVSLETLTTLKE